VPMPAQTQCYRCGADLRASNPERCPRCGRRQTRTCFCLLKLPRTVSVCPNCHTDWSYIDRVRAQERAEAVALERSARLRRVGTWAVVVILALGLAAAWLLMRG